MTTKTVVPPIALAGEPVARVSADQCAEDVYRHGQSIGLFDIPKETANEICAGITTVTGARVDWHYIAGRVHMKALAAPSASPAPSVDQIVREAKRFATYWAGASKANQDEAEAVLRRALLQANGETK